MQVRGGRSESGAVASLALGDLGSCSLSPKNRNLKRVPPIREAPRNPETSIRTLAHP